MKVGTNIQPGLGRIQDNYKPHIKMGEYFCLAKIIRIHHKHNTVDVQLLKSKSLITSNPENEGKFGARILVPSAHFDINSLSYSGTIEPLQEGQIVVVAFMDSLKQQPIILGSFHNTWKNENNILTHKYPLKPEESVEDLKEALKYLKVLPSQFYVRIDGIGGMEISHPSKSFLKIDADTSDMTDKHKGFDHKNLKEKNKRSGETLSAHSELSAISPRLLYVHRTSYDDEDATWTKFFLSSTGMFRVTRDNDDNALTYAEMSPEGGFKIKRQLDSPVHDEGQMNTELSIEETGGIKVKKNTTSGSSTIEITEGNEINITHHTGSYIKFTNNGDIIIKPNRHVYIG